MRRYEEGGNEKGRYQGESKGDGDIRKEGGKIGKLYFFPQSLLLSEIHTYFWLRYGPAL